MDELGPKMRDAMDEHDNMESLAGLINETIFDLDGQFSRLSVLINQFNNEQKKSDPKALEYTRKSEAIFIQRMTLYDNLTKTINKKNEFKNKYETYRKELQKILIERNELLNQMKTTIFEPTTIVPSTVNKLEMLNLLDKQMDEVSANIRDAYDEHEDMESLSDSLNQTILDLQRQYLNLTLLIEEIPIEQRNSDPQALEYSSRRDEILIQRNQHYDNLTQTEIRKNELKNEYDAYRAQLQKLLNERNELQNQIKNDIFEPTTIIPSTVASREDIKLRLESLSKEINNTIINMEKINIQIGESEDKASSLNEMLKECETNINLLDAQIEELRNNNQTSDPQFESLIDEKNRKLNEYGDRMTNISLHERETSRLYGILNRHNGMLDVLQKEYHKLTKLTRSKE